MIPGLQQVDPLIADSVDQPVLICFSSDSAIYFIDPAPGLPEESHCL